MSILVIDSDSGLHGHVIIHTVLRDVSIGRVHLHPPALTVIALVLLVLVSQGLQIAPLIIGGSSLLAIALRHGIIDVKGR